MHEELIKRLKSYIEMLRSPDMECRLLAATLIQTDKEVMDRCFSRVQNIDDPKILFTETYLKGPRLRIMYCLKHPSLHRKGYDY